MADLAQEPIEASSFPFLARRGAQLLLLMVAALAGIYARNCIGPLQETMRLALSLSDNQIALLQGTALALPLLVAAVPLGLAVDRYSRVRMLLLPTVLSLVGSVATALAPSFATLFAARCLIGLAAPATAIAAFSLLADLYSPAQRGRATMAVVLGQSAGSSAAFALGGELLTMSGSDPDGWRWAMFGMSVLLAPVVILVLALREPARTGVVVAKPRLREIWPELYRYRGVIAILLAAMSLVNLADGAVLVWAAPTLARNYGLAPDRIGVVMAAALLVGGVSGPIVGGMVADLCQSVGGPRRTVTVLAVLALGSVPMSLFPVMSGIVPASIALVVFVAIGTALSVMTTAVSIVVIPNELRGLCVSIKFAFGVVFGLGVAPLTVSQLSGAMGGQAMIGRALALVCFSMSLLGAVIFAFGRRYFPRAAAARQTGE